ncbi:MAG: glutaminyl-peptide cyclotransferase [Luteolibacter sp.]
MKTLLLPLFLALGLTACRPSGPATLSYTVVATIPHDPECYTQGLEFSGQRLFESGGQYGQSSVREVDPATGEVLRKRPMPRTSFAEGITFLNGELWVLTWKEQTVSVLDPDTLGFLRSYSYEGEGWGLATDGKSLIMSDGSDQLKYRNPKTFALEKTLRVTDGGRPVEKLNELEMVGGEIYANIYTTDKIARISLENGHVTGWLDLSGLRRQLPAPHRAEVLNGIARTPDGEHLLVTGKYWPRMFRIQVKE